MAGKVRARPATTPGAGEPVSTDALRTDTTTSTQPDAPDQTTRISKRATRKTEAEAAAEGVTKPSIKTKTGVETTRAKKPVPKKPVAKKNVGQPRVGKPGIAGKSSAAEWPARVVSAEEPAALADKPAIRRSLTGRALVTRVARAVERELTEIEAIAGKSKSRTDAERRTRTLASLARTLAEVTRLREQQQARREDDNDAVPRDLDEFRATLARRLDKIIADRSLRAAGDDEPGGA